jgi:hypothetical protein
VGTIKLHFEPEVFLYRSATPFPTYIKNEGTVSPLTGLAFDKAAEQTAFLKFRAINYGSGNWTALVGWYAETATTGSVVLAVSAVALTANTDVVTSGGVAFDSENLLADSHLGTIGQRPHDMVGTLASLNAVATNDWVTLKIARKVANVGDTMTGKMVLTSLDLSYSDT